MKKIIVALSLVVVVSSCTKDKSDELITEVVDDTVQTYCDTVTVSFSNQVLPIFIQNCATSGCHDATVSGTYQFETHGQISNSFHIAAALSTINHESGFSPMPKFQSKLHDSLIQQIECWIDQGKLNN